MRTGKRLHPLDHWESAQVDDEPDVRVEPFPYWGTILIACFLGGLAVWVVIWEVLA